MIFTHTWENETIFHEAYVTDEKFFNVAIREVTEGGDPMEDFVDMILFMVHQMTNLQKSVTTFTTFFY